jgi:hypothetical protein
MIYFIIGMSLVVTLIFWYCLPDKDEVDSNPYS